MVRDFGRALNQHDCEWSVPGALAYGEYPWTQAN